MNSLEGHPPCFQSFCLGSWAKTITRKEGVCPSGRILQKIYFALVLNDLLNHPNEIEITVPLLGKILRDV